MDYDTLKNTIVDSMKLGNTAVRDTLRMVVNEVDNLRIAEQRDITEQDVTAMIKRVLKQTNETLEASIQANNNQERTNMLQERVKILEELLPAQLEGAELIDKIDSIIAKISNPSKKSIGQIMKQLNQETDGNFDKASAGQYLNKVL